MCNRDGHLLKVVSGNWKTKYRHVGKHAQSTMYIDYIYFYITILLYRELVTTGNGNDNNDNDIYT